MTKRNEFLLVMLMVAVVATLFPLARPVQAQDTNPRPGHVAIHMVGILVYLQKTIDAKKAKPGEKFTVETAYTAKLNDGTVVPKGSYFEGHVVSATPSKQHGDSTLVVTIDKLKLKKGKVISVKSVVMNVSYGLSNCPGCGFTQDSDLLSQRISGGVAGLPDGEESQMAIKLRGNAIQGLTVTNSVTSSNSGTFTQKRKNVHLANGDELGIGVAVIPKGVVLKK